jgi:hypothetical protein
MFSTTTAADVLPPFRRWRELAAKKRRDAQKQIPITNFFPKYSFTILQNLTYYLCEMFSFDAALYFLRNLIMSKTEL